jgi:hypothetical protein
MDGESGVLPQKEKKHKLIGDITLLNASHQWQWTQRWNLKYIQKMDEKSPIMEKKLMNKDGVM